VLFAPKLTAPDKEDVPVDADKVPPFKATASAPTATPCRSKVAPLATVVPPLVAPKPAALVTAKVPAETVVVPVWVLVPETVNVPEPDLTNWPEPDTVPEMAESLPVTAISKWFVDRLVLPDKVAWLALSLTFVSGVPTNKLAADEAVVTESMDSEPPTYKPPEAS
jgi:hypothetical protein